MSHSHSPHISELNSILTSFRAGDELGEMLDARAIECLSADEATKFTALLRRLGHAFNQAGDFEAAAFSFECAYQVSRAAPDLLSAANMLLKVDGASTLAEALYTHVMTMMEVTQSQFEMATRKLAEVNARRHRDLRGGYLSARSAEPEIGGRLPDDAYRWRIDETLITE